MFDNVSKKLDIEVPSNRMLDAWFYVICSTKKTDFRKTMLIFLE